MLAAFLAAACPGFRAQLPGLIRPRVAATLAALMAATGLLSASGALARLADTAARKWSDPRLGLLVALTGLGLASSIATNDAAVLVAVPVALEAAERGGMPRWAALGAATVAVNIGSSLLPLGNPQNLLIWHDYGVGFADFAETMTPMVLLGFALLAATLLLSTRNRGSRPQPPGPPPAVDTGKAAAGAAALAAIAASSAAGRPLLGDALAATLAAAAWPRSLLAIDPWVLATLSLMFADFSYLGAVLAAHMPAWLLGSRLGVYAAALLLSQAVSNVPAAAALSLHTPHWRALAYGVDVGGVMLATGSLANLIALRLAEAKPGELHRFQLRVAVPLAAACAALLAAGLTP